MQYLVGKRKAQGPLRAQRRGPNLGSHFREAFRGGVEGISLAIVSFHHRVPWGPITSGRGTEISPEQGTLIQFLVGKVDQTGQILPATLLLLLLPLSPTPSGWTSQYASTGGHCPSLPLSYEEKNQENDPR